MPSSYSPPSSPSYLYPTVCDLSEVEYQTTASITGSLSTSSSSGEQKQFCCPYTANGTSSLEFSFADLGKDFHDLLGQPILSDMTLQAEEKQVGRAIPDNREFQELAKSDVECPSGSENESLKKLSSSHNNEVLRSVPVVEDSCFSFADANKCSQSQRWRRPSWRTLWKGRKRDSALRHQQDDSNVQFHDLYELSRKISTGRNFTVWDCIDRATKQLFLTKIFKWRSDQELIQIYEELDILAHIAVKKDVQRDRFVCLEQIFWTQDTVFTVMTSPGQDIRTLQSIILHDGRFKEDRVGRIACFLLEDLSQLQHIEIYHRFLQPQDILICGDDTPCIMGYAYAMFSKGTNARSDSEYAATSASSVASFSAVDSVNEYIAPEFLRLPPIARFRDAESYGGGFWSDAVMWSVGVLIVHCFNGAALQNSCSDLYGFTRSRHFCHKSDSALVLGRPKATQTVSCHHCRSTVSSHTSLSAQSLEHSWSNFHLPKSTSLSKSAKQFLMICLHEDPTIRMTVAEALEHPWIAARRALHRKGASHAMPKLKKKFRWWQRTRSQKSKRHCERLL